MFATPLLHPPQPVSRQRGMSLVEMMIGLAIGLVISAALLLLFANASTQGQNQQRTSAHIENGRYATDLLREDLALAGFFGETVVPGRPSDPTLSLYVSPDPCATVPAGYFTAASGYLFPTPLRGYGAAEVLGCLSNRRAGTDAVAVRRVDITTVAAGALAASNQRFHLQYSFCEDDPPTPPLVFSTSSGAFTLRNLGCTGAATARPFVSRIYFIADCNECGVDTTPTLKRLDLEGNSLVETALVEGVETMRFEYGFDTDQDGDVDEYRTAPAAAGEASFWENVVSLRAHLIVRSLDRVAGASALASAQSFELGAVGTVDTARDGFVRRAYSSTIRLVNPSDAREAP